MGVAQVVVEVEAGVVDPHGMPEERDVLEALAIARDAMHPRRDAGPDALDVDATVRRPERPASKIATAPMCMCDEASSSSRKLSSSADNRS